MPVPRYRHIVWDWNGTLLDDLDYSIGVMNTLLARRALPLLDRARYHALFDFPVRDYYYRLGFDQASDSSAPNSSAATMPTVGTVSSTARPPGPSQRRAPAV
jgi:phosphoglycolate phosphatase